MKKKIITIAAIGSFVLLTAAYTFFFTEKNQINSLMLENIEALADSEGSDHSKDQPFVITCNTPYLNGACTSTVITCQGGGSGCTPRPCSIHH